LAYLQLKDWNVSPVCRYRSPRTEGGS